MTAVAIKSSPRWQGLKLTGKRLDSGDMEPGEPLTITCHGHTEQGLCPGCREDFDRVLADVPELLDDLDTAIGGPVQFIEHGIRYGALGEDVAAGPSHHPAVSAYNRLNIAIFGDGTAAHPGCKDWFDARSDAGLARQLKRHLPRLTSEARMPVLAHDISAAAKRAHYVIDAPHDLVFYGPCPDCGRDILQERIHKDDNDTQVVCRYPSCNYAKTLDLHYKRIIDTNLDRQFTIDDCIGMITNAGEPVTRNQIYGWIRHKGLPREWSEIPEWRDGVPVMVGRWTLRLRDVLDFARRSEEKKLRKTAV